MFKIYNDDCLKVLKTKPSNSIDSIITDPPAGIGFMGKDWDKDKGGRKEWVAWMTEVMSECLRVLKPGGHALVWSIPRTSHWTATALEDAGFEVRDCITHLFGSGFPKSQDISKAIDKAAGVEREVVGVSKYADRNPNGHQTGNGMGKIVMSADVTAPATPEAKQWDGWGTALKPAAEFWWLVRKPLSEKTVAKNVLKHGTGGINIDASRIDTVDNLNGGAYRNQGERDPSSFLLVSTGKEFVQPQGRFPANLILSHHPECVELCHDDCPVKRLDEQSGVSKSARAGMTLTNTPARSWKNTSIAGIQRIEHGDTGGASRFFYCAKASKRDKGAGNTHPTVKNTKLMEYLIKLITPPGGVVLDPFMGSGSTGVAALRLGFRFFGIEQDAGYCEIAERRLSSNV